MVRVAIAGGTGAMGRTFMDVLRRNPTHQAIALSRGSKDSSPDVFKVDYENISELQEILEKFQIEVVIATFHMSTSALKVAQLNTIQASIQASCVKRFIPTSFAMAYPKEAVAELPPLQYWFEAIDRLEQSELEWTIVNNGLFLDYFAPKSLRSHLTPNTIAVDIPHQVAAIPGDGDVSITFTYTFDVAEYVVEALSLPRWERETEIIGDTVTWNKFVAMAEQVLGAKFKITYDTLKQLRSHQITELPAHEELYAAFPKPQLQFFLSVFELWTAEGRAALRSEGSLNQEFPAIKPLNVRSVIEMHAK